MSYFSRIYLLSLHITKTNIYNEKFSFLPDSLFYFYPQYRVKRLKKEV